MSIIYAKLLAILFANALTSKPEPPPQPSRAHIDALQDFQDCLDDRDLTAEDNDGHCDDPRDW